MSDSVLYLYDVPAKYDADSLKQFVFFATGITEDLVRSCQKIDCRNDSYTLKISLKERLTDQQIISYIKRPLHVQDACFRISVKQEELRFTGVAFVEERDIGLVNAKAAEQKMDFSVQSLASGLNLKFTRSAENAPWHVQGYLSDLAKFETECNKLLSRSLMNDLDMDQHMESQNDFELVTKSKQSDNSSSYGLNSSENYANNSNFIGQPADFDVKSSAQPKSRLGGLFSFISGSRQSDLPPPPVHDEPVFGLLDVQVINADLTEIKVDAIVNGIPYNNRARITDELRKVGDTAYSASSDRLRSKFLIDVMIPPKGNSMDSYITLCLENSLEKAKFLEIESIAYLPIFKDNPKQFGALAQDMLKRRLQKDTLGTIKMVYFLAEEGGYMAVFKKALFSNEVVVSSLTVAGPSTSSKNKADISKDDENMATNKSQADKEEERCPICLDSSLELFPTVLTECCKKPLHKICLEKCLERISKCPLCSQRNGKLPFGNQPLGGIMTWSVDKFARLPGYKDAAGIIRIVYDFMPGLQGPNHPNPGRPYFHTSRDAYLPNIARGQIICRMLKKAFDQGLIFTIGDSVSTGKKDCIVWNGIHHKTNTHGGSSNYGYPDETYLDRVESELKDAGIEKSMISSGSFPYFFRG